MMLGGEELSTSLDAAYRATRYRVVTAQGQQLVRVGAHHAVLDALCEAALPPATPRGWAILTAHNPRSVLLSPSENASRAERLRQELDQLASVLSDDQRGLLVFPAVGASPDGSWSEESVWVAGLSELEARILGARYQQNAVVTGSVGVAACLSWVVVQPPLQGICSDLRCPRDTDGPSAVGALRRIAEALSRGSAIDDSTLRGASVRWADVLEHAGAPPPALAVLDLDDLAEDLECIPESGANLGVPTSNEVRVFSVRWSDGAVLVVACLLSEGLGEPCQDAVAFGISEEDAVAALLAGTARQVGEQTDPDLEITASLLEQYVDAL